MSTKTTIKRIALVAVAALGFGMLSVVPSNATASNVVVSLVSNGTSTNSTDDYVSDSTTAGIISVSAILGSTQDTMTVTFLEKSKPSGADATPYSYFVDSTTTRASSTIVDTATLGTAAGASIPKMLSASTNTTDGSAQAIGTAFRVLAGSAGYVGAKFAVQMDSTAARTVAGDYIYTAVVTIYNNGAATPSATTYTQDVTVSVDAKLSANTTIAPASSSAFIGTSTGATSDAVISAVATASTTPVAYIRVNTKNSNGNAKPESVTATLTGGAGLLSFGGVSGTSMVLNMDGDDDISILANGVAGVATITLSTPTASFSPKTVTFYAKAAKTLTASVYNPVLAVGANASAVAVSAVDVNGTNWAGKAYIVASAAADALIGGSATTPVACSYNSTVKLHFCPITTKATGTANFKVIDAATVALATATSNEVTVTVSNSAPTSVKLAFDKATYQPFEKAYITVTVLGADGKTLQGQTFANLFATGGITATQGFGSGSDTLTAVSVITDGANSATTPTTAGAKTYTVYMPAQGTVEISATGGTSLAAAGQVKVTASAEIVNDAITAAVDAAGDATEAANAATDAANAAAEAADAATAAAQDAQAAVADLAAQVATLISGIKAQITRLTNLVIKIQKKVNA